jgi:hypothetical protein
MTEPVRVFVNGRGLSVAPGTTVLDAVAAADPEAAALLRSGERVVADSRGLPVANDTPVSGGFVMRIVSSRQRADSPDGI